MYESCSGGFPLSRLYLPAAALVPEVPDLVDYEDPPLRHAHCAVGRHVSRLVAVTSAVGAGAGEQGGQLRQTLDLP